MVEPDGDSGTDDDGSDDDETGEPALIFYMFQGKMCISCLARRLSGAMMLAIASVGTSGAHLDKRIVGP